MRTLEQHDTHQHLHYRGTRSRRERERARAHNKNFLNMGKEPLTQIQEAQRVQQKTNRRRNTPRHIFMKLTKIKDKQKMLRGGQDGGGVGGHARPLPQTQQKKHIYRINDLHRTATNRWQRNLNSNNGKKFVTLLGRTGEKRRVREGESERDGRSRKGTAEEKGILHPGKSPTGRKIK